jgi:hypothetical protein
MNVLVLPVQENASKTYGYSLWVRGCYDYAGRTLDSVVMTTRAENSISHGLIIRVVVRR